MERKSKEMRSTEGPLVVRAAKLHEGAVLPTYATIGAACFDFYACEDILLRRGSTRKVPTGLSFEIPEGYFMDIRPRSGLASEGIILVNSPGTVDSDYRGEVIILLRSLDRDWKLYRGNRVAQGRVIKTCPVIFDLVAEQLSSTERGSGGFGSTGR